MKILDIITSPWAISPECLTEIRQVYAAHMRGDKINWEGIKASIDSFGPSRSENLYTVQAGVAVIEITGPITKGSSFLSFLFGGMTVDDISNAFAMALVDDAVQSILLLVNSPGGSILGVQELASQIYEGRGQKPITTYCDGVMASAAYWLGSASGKVYISGQTNMIGHIGVIFTHITDKWEDETKFYAGKYKHIDAGGELNDEDKGILQARVDYIYSIFVSDIAKFRGVSTETVLSNMAEGRVFLGQQAVTAGLVDGIATFDSVHQGLAVGDMAMARAFSKFEANLKNLKGATL